MLEAYLFVMVLITDDSAFLAFEVLHLASDERGGSSIEAAFRICCINREPYKNKEFRRFPIVIIFDSFIIEHVAVNCCLR